MRYLISAPRIFDGENYHEEMGLVINHGYIEEIISLNNKPYNILEIKCNEGTLIPGFLDIQVNGGGGLLLNDAPTLETLKTMIAAHRKFGTVGLLPTLITANEITTYETLEVIREGIKTGLPGLLGVHLEGPVINPKRKGIHDGALMRGFDARLFDEITSRNLGQVLVTIAPELVDPYLIHDLNKAGVHVFAGHTAATSDDIEQALMYGLKGFTHLFNAMTPMESRNPGVVGVALNDESSWCGIINDGHHVHPTVLKNAIRAKARGKMILVTDAMSTIGSDQTSFELDGRTIYRKEGKLVDADNTLAGADLDMITAVKNTCNLGISLAESIRMASLYPAQCLGLHKQYGRLLVGYKAEFNLIDPNLNILTIPDPQ